MFCIIPSKIKKFFWKLLVLFFLVNAWQGLLLGCGDSCQIWSEEKHIIENLARVNLAVSFYLSHGTYTVHLRQCIQYACVCLGKKSTANKHVWCPLAPVYAHRMRPELRTILHCERHVYLVVFTNRWQKSTFKKMLYNTKLWIIFFLYFSWLF